MVPKNSWTLLKIRKWLTKKEKDGFNYLHESCQSLNVTGFCPSIKR